MSLIVKIGALLVIFFMPTKFAVDLQLLGGVWMVQIFPAMIFGLFTRWFSGCGAAGRLGGRHDRRHRAVVDAEGLDAGACARLGHPADRHVDLGALGLHSPPTMA